MTTFIPSFLHLPSFLVFCPVAYLSLTLPDLGKAIIMDFIQRNRKPRPYAANSTGRPRGTLKLGSGLGRVQVYEAIGEARDVFVNELSHAIVSYLNDNSDELQDSASFVDLSLFMMVKSADGTKPIVMFVSDDKRVRKQAFRMIKQSGIMKEYPDFGLGEMDLKAEFEDLRPLGSLPDLTSALGADSQPMAFEAPEERIEVFENKTERCRGRRLEVQFQHGSTTRASQAVAGGAVSYKNRYLLHSVGHFLREAPQGQVMDTRRQSFASESSDDECEIMGLSDDDDEDDDEAVTVTSRGIQTPVPSDSELASNSPLDIEAHGIRIAGREEDRFPSSAPHHGQQHQSPSAGRVRPLREKRSGTVIILETTSGDSRPKPSQGSFVNEGEDDVLSGELTPVSLASRPFEELLAALNRASRGEPKQIPHQTPLSYGQSVRIGHVALISTLLDSALVQLDTGTANASDGDMPEPQDTAIRLESYQEHIETRPSDTGIRISTATDTISGTLSGTPSFVRLPGSRIFQEVYTAILYRPLLPGDCGSWARHAVSGKLFGHVIAGSPTTGLVLVMPAAKVFAEALAALSASEAKLEGVTSTG
ncbi:hypothetical protein N658DRAFT_540749 [Parathielavia hyrcaniae]|uniref:Uncharacterized protein n=1 Tax=Parathielavia hyrcaniae TaxID=113614 RepID=A0AAN6Q1I3_9PEZI|nr:hypothetical protein N658DRAFT_540749 [Parathielavia hyrcaniae]